MHLGLIAILAIASVFASGTVHVNKDGSSVIHKEALKKNAKAEYKVNE
jgi:hypothetical protein